MMSPTTKRRTRTIESEKKARAESSGAGATERSEHRTPVETSDQLGYARSVFETVREPLLLLDGAGVVHMANPAFLRAFATTHEATIGQPLHTLSNGHWNIPALNDRLRELQQSGEPFVDLEMAQRFEGIGERVMILSGRLLDAPHTSNRMALLAILDVTERHRAEKVLAWHAAELQRSNRDLEGYALVASHDLQEPLRKIRAYGDLLLTECGPLLDDAGRDYATRMIAASARMQTLVGDLLRLALVATTPRIYARVSLQDVVRDVLIDMDLQMRNSGAVVQVGELPDIECDRAQMGQLFQNLISNAIKFRGDVPPDIRITAGPAPTPAFAWARDGDPWIALRISDNGIGFEPRHADTIFEPFQRLHGRGTYEGTGIGLTLCRRICERHSGSITTTSVAGVSTEFTVTLPSRQPAPH